MQKDALANHWNGTRFADRGREGPHDDERSNQVFGKAIQMSCDLFGQQLD